MSIFNHKHCLKDDVFIQKLNRFCDGRSVYNSNQNLAHVENRGLSFTYYGLCLAAFFFCVLQFFQGYSWTRPLRASSEVYVEMQPYDHSTEQVACTSKSLEPSDRSLGSAPSGATFEAFNIHWTREGPPCMPICEYGPCQGP